MKRLGFLIVILFCIRCGKIEIAATDPGIEYDGATLIYKKEKFSGYLVTEFEANGVLRKTPYLGGILEGKEVEIFPNGQIASERFYKEGKRVGVHKGWFENGQIRFQYEYEDGLMHGSLWEWNKKGELYSYAKMNKGEEIGRKVWREDGQIYANYVFRNGRTVGLPGAKLCRQIKGDENGNTKAF